MASPTAVPVFDTFSLAYAPQVDTYYSVTADLNDPRLSSAAFSLCETQFLPPLVLGWRVPSLPPIHEAEIVSVTLRDGIPGVPCQARASRVSGVTCGVDSRE